MRIVSLNAWGGAMYDALAEWLPGCGGDVVCLQEVTRTPGLRGWTEFRDDERVLPQRADLFADVCELLPDHQGFFVTSDRGPVVDRQGREHRQDFGLAVFVDARWPVIGQAAGFIHGTFTDHPAWVVEDRPRIAQAVRVVGHPDGPPVAVVHAHGLRDPAGKHDTPARRAQADRLVGLVEQIAGPGDRTVLCGDLNLLPDSETFAVLAGRGLVDLVGRADTRTSRYRKPLRHADYLLVDEPEAVERFEILAEPEVSDHRPLILDLAGPSA